MYVIRINRYTKTVIVHEDSERIGLIVASYWIAHALHAIFPGNFDDKVTRSVSEDNVDVIGL